ncbi:MAG: nitronate monooxygenase [Polaromonas sp.]|nr:nitronate monooxygenase [Polaromonas sp.]
MAALGLDPENLPSADKSTMDFNSKGNMDKKAWRDIWSAGQGLGSITDVPTMQACVARLTAEYQEAHNALALRSGF